MPNIKPTANAPGAISCFVILIHLHRPLDPDATAFGAERFHSTRSLQRDGRALTARQRAEVTRSPAAAEQTCFGAVKLVRGGPRRSRRRGEGGCRVSSSPSS